MMLAKIEVMVKTRENRGEKQKKRAIRTTPFWKLLGTFRSLSEVHFMRTISRFKAWEVKNPTLQTVDDLELK